MDAAARRREVRKRKILQNAKDRIKKLTGNVDADVKHEENIDSNNALKISAHKNVNNYSTKVDQNCETTTTSPGEKALKGNSSLGQNELTTKQDGHVGEKSVDETKEKQSDGRFGHQTTAALSTEKNENIHIIKENVFDGNFFKHEDEPAEMRDKTDGYARKERHGISQDQNDENGTEFIIAEPEDVDSQISNVRSVIVMILAILCFTKDLYFPALSSILSLSWFLEICNENEFSFVIPFCILEVVLLFMPSIRKVTPGKQVNIWLLALKLCGVSPAIVDAAKIIILEILELLTDLAMFIFVLVILQNVKEFYVQNTFVFK